MVQKVQEVHNVHKGRRPKKIEENVTFSALGVGEGGAAVGGHTP